MKALRTALVVFVVISTSNLANATIVGTTLTFNGAELDLFTVQSSSPTYTINDLGSDLAVNAVVAGPTYSDSVPAMSGQAGATGGWTTAGSGASVDVFLGTTFAATDLSAFGLTHLREVAFNDNDDIWGHDVWIDITDNATFDPVSSAFVNVNGSTKGDPRSAKLSLDISALDLSAVVGWGVSVHGNLDGRDFPSPGDSHHTSWAAVPEPGAIVIWSLMGLTCVGVFWGKKPDAA